MTAPEIPARPANLLQYWSSFRCIILSERKISNKFHLLIVISPFWCKQLAQFFCSVHLHVLTVDSFMQQFPGDFRRRFDGKNNSIRNSRSCSEQSHRLPDDLRCSACSACAEISVSAAPPHRQWVGVRWRFCMLQPLNQDDAGKVAAGKGVPCVFPVRGATAGKEITSGGQFDVLR